MAPDIRSSSVGTSSTSSSQSSSTKSRGDDQFAQDLAVAARSAPKSAAVKQVKHTAAPPKPATTSKPAGSPKPKPAAESADSNSKPATGQRTAIARPKAPAAAQPTPQQNSAPEDAAAAAAEANADGTASANAAKGRAPNRTVAKNSAPQTAAAAAANKAGDAIDDPGADSANQSGLRLLQLLAQSLEGDDTDGTPTDTAAPAATDQTSDNGTDKMSDDPSAIALAMFTQALAAALARQATPNSNAAAGDATAGIAAATQSPGGAAATQSPGIAAATQSPGIAAATQSPGGAAATQSPGGATSMQDLMSVLAHDVAAGAQGKSDDGAAQVNAGTTKGSATDTGSIDTTAVGPNSLAHLGVASHFSAPHPRNDTNTGEVRAAVGSSAWDEELGTQLTWMTQKGLETGSLRISPEHLGPVEVNISVHNGDASVWFAAHHPDTRAALEQALPKLREMFANQGMNLADSGVSRQSLSQNGSRNQSRSTASQGISGVAAVGGADSSASAAVRTSLGLVDTYA